MPQGYVAMGTLSAVVIVAIVSLAATFATERATNDFREHAESELKRLREGTLLVDELGTVQPAGERWLFTFEDEPRQFVLLENLNLQRIVELHRAGQTGSWSLSGVVTECRGRNYLLVSRAILKSGQEPSVSSPR